MTVLLALIFALLRSRVGAFIQAIRDSEEAVGSLGVRVLQNKRLIFVLSAFGCAAAGALWLVVSVVVIVWRIPVYQAARKAAEPWPLRKSKP